MTSQEKREIAKAFIEKTKPYEKQESLKFDLRGYAKYLEEHNIPGNEVPDEVLNRFKRKQK